MSREQRPAEPERGPGGEGPAEETVPFFVHRLVAQLTWAEQAKGAPLTEAEVLRVRDRALVVLLSPEVARRMQEARPDIDPENCWAEWQAHRATRSNRDIAPGTTAGSVDG